MKQEITLAQLIRNKTLSVEVAGLIMAAVEEGASFLTVAIPRFAGKSTLKNAILLLLPENVPINNVSDDPKLFELLKKKRFGGYLVVDEFSRFPVMPTYIWGEPVRKVFDLLSLGYSLAGSLHAESAEGAIELITKENGVSDQQASVIKLILYIEMFGTDPSNAVRRLSLVYEVDKVKNGKPIGHPLFLWDGDEDKFISVSKSHFFVKSKKDVKERIKPSKA